ncbi:hypothetical protein GTP38_11215 [Duganella sp. FT94W]|uniref:Uncharacterized protein n=1 Tax=Duganella lactea TaxID=2692173 RepID=A0ABW9V6G5_9BURK|nr:hypothetical protein [Duganella lactea]MYM34908.1 hypothetical protein [Duganella lactea]
MIYDLSRADRQHRAIVNEKPAPVLQSKRCACGARAFAKQLAQHGKCAACQFTDRAAALLPEDLEILHHMLGATPHHAMARWGFRNEYLVNRRDLPSIERLAAAGFVRAGQPLLQLQYFHATSAGCKLAGLSAKRVEVALLLGVAQ